MSVDDGYCLGDLRTILANASVAPLVAVVSPDDHLSCRIEGDRFWLLGFGRTVGACRWFAVTEGVLAATTKTITEALGRTGEP